MNLPIIEVQVTGNMTLQSNIEDFSSKLTEFVQSINANPQSDEDFVLLDEQRKVLANAEDLLKGVKKKVLDSNVVIADILHQIDDCNTVARNARLKAEKILKDAKAQRIEQLIYSRTQKLSQQVKVLDDALGYAGLLPAHSATLRDAVKGLKTLSSMEQKLDVQLMKLLDEVNQEHKRIESNISYIQEQGLGNSSNLARMAKMPYAELQALVEDIRARAEVDAQKKVEQIAIRNSTVVEVAPVVEVTLRNSVNPVSIAIVASLTIPQLHKSLGFAVSMEFLKTIGVEFECVGIRIVGTDLRIICEKIQHHLTLVIRKELVK